MLKSIEVKVTFNCPEWLDEQEVVDEIARVLDYAKLPVGEMEVEINEED